MIYLPAMDPKFPLQSFVPVRFRVPVQLVFLTWFLIHAGIGYADDGQRVSYQKQVAPVLQKYCLGCHGAADPEHQLSLQSPAEIRKGDSDGLVLNPDNLAESRLLKVLLSNADDHMPPKDEPQLSADELTALKNWVLEGAVFDGSTDGLIKVPSVAVTAKNIVNPVVSLVISPDGTTAAAGQFRTVTLYSLPELKQTATIALPDGKVTDLEFLNESQLLAGTGLTGFSGKAALLDIAESKTAEEFPGHHDMVYAVCRSSLGIIATGGYDRRILLHDPASGNPIRELKGHNGAIFDLAFSPDGTLLASASADATIKVWNSATGERLDTMSQPLSEQYGVVFSKDGNFIFAAGADNRIRKWRVVSRTSAQINPLTESRFAHEGAIHELVLSPDGKLLATAAEDGTVKIWEAGHLTELASFRREAGVVTALAFVSASSELLAGTSNGEIMRFAVPSSAAAAADSRLMAATRDTPAVPATADAASITETEPNNAVETAQPLPFPSTVSGIVFSPDAVGTHDADYFRFSAVAGQEILLETRASRDKSPLDSRIEILDSEGRPVLQTQLQAVRDSWFAFRGKDSETVDDFRMFNWQEMELNEYLYADGEVCRLWLYPRGPDSGFKVYPGIGQRRTYFNTTAVTHPLQGPAFIVVPHEPGEKITENGLPVFPVYYENDDDSFREWGSDSRLLFRSPADGEYIVRLTDARGFSGEDYRYQLILRSPQPDFGVTLGGDKVAVQPGTGRELSFTVRRIDGFMGPIELIAEGLPAGFDLSLPTEIQEDQQQAFVTLFATEGAVQPDETAVKNVRLKARAKINGTEVIHDIGGLQELKILDKPKIRIVILSEDQAQPGNVDHSPELTVYAGETTRAIVRSVRNDFAGHIELGKEDAGRNMPHGVFVDNIGLNGLMILQDQNEREVFITVAKWVPETSRTFYLKSNVDGITSLPVMLHVRHRNSNSPGSTTAAR